MIYRVQVPAVLYFDVKADSEAHARREAVRHIANVEWFDLERENAETLLGGASYPRYGIGLDDVEIVEARELEDDEADDQPYTLDVDLSARCIGGNPTEPGRPCLDPECPCARALAAEQSPTVEEA